MRHLELRPDDGAGRTAAPFREVEALARWARVGGWIAVVIGSVLNAVGAACGGVLVVLSLFGFGSGDGAGADLKSVLLYAVAPGTAMIVLGSLYAMRTNYARLCLASIAISGSLFVGPHALVALGRVLWAVGVFGAAIV